MIRAIIIDDERPSAETLRHLIHDYCPTVDVVAIANTVAVASQLIVDHNPDLIFLDVVMEEETGFDLFKSFPLPAFDTIFTTGHKEHALEAIKYSCLDYLLKPIDFRDLQKAVKKREARIEKATGKLIENMVHNLGVESSLKQIAIPNVTGFEFVKIADIVMAKANGNYSQIFTMTNDIITTRTLGEFENLLPKPLFFRSHKSFLISWNHIEKYNRQDNLIFMKRGLTADLALRRKEEFIKSIQSSDRV